MLTVPEVVTAMQDVLGPVADRAARATGFVRRRSKLTGASFVQMLVLGWWSTPQATREALAQTAALRGISVSPQAVDQRLHARAAACLRQVLAHAARTLLTTDPVAIPLLQRFSQVVVQDSTSIGLPGALAEEWPGCGNATTPAAASATLKLHLRLDLAGGGLAGPVLQPGRTHDTPAVPGFTPLAAGGLWIGDLGFFSLDQFAAWDAAGCFWLSRLKADPVLRDPTTGQRLALDQVLPTQPGACLEREVLLGAQQRLRCRLLAVRVPPAVAAERRAKLHAEARRRGQAVSARRLRWADWTLLVTNVPAAQLALDEALVLYRARWQIELLIKLWKHDARLATWRSTKPWAVLCELYAKLLAVVCQHWTMLVSCWPAADRSLPKAAQTVRKLVWALARVWDDTPQAVAVLVDLQRCLAHGCRINKRRTTPHTYQLLLAPARGGLG
ncbi:MAG: IS4 family transposase [Planctomycetes bacterium]|nr:IS4 family transposase [Planctomycetota bacterium]